MKFLGDTIKNIEDEFYGEMQVALSEYVADFERFLDTNAEKLAEASENACTVEEIKQRKISLEGAYILGRLAEIRVAIHSMAECMSVIAKQSGIEVPEFPKSTVH